MTVQAVITAVLVVVGSRIAVAGLIVPAWRREQLGDGTAAVLVATWRAVTLALLVLAGVAAFNLPWMPGLLTGLAVGLIYAVVGWRGIRHMFATSSINPRNPR